MASIKINTDGFNRKVNQLASHTKSNVRAVFKNECRLLVGEIGNDAGHGQIL